jgi:hypothetical protein
VTAQPAHTRDHPVAGGLRAAVEGAGGRGAGVGGGEDRGGGREDWGWVDGVVD